MFTKPSILLITKIKRCPNTFAPFWGHLKNGDINHCPENKNIIVYHEDEEESKGSKIHNVIFLAGFMVSGLR